MSAPRITVATANTILDAGIGSLANDGKLAIYDGTQPASGGGSITTQTKLVEFTMDSDAFPAASSGVLTANPMGAAAAIASGLGSWFRMTRSNGTHILDGDVGESGSGADCIITDTDITTLDVVAVLSLQITQPTS